VIRLAEVIDDIGRREPRASQAQREALRNLLATDPDARLEGLDQRQRIVVNAKSGFPRQSRRYALMRNGDPAAVSGRLAETWSRR
jgi:hypothetical protein